MTMATTTMKTEDAATEREPYQCTYCGKVGHTWIVAGRSRRMKVEESDAAAMAVDAGLTTSSGDNIVMKTATTIK